MRARRGEFGEGFGQAIRESLGHDRIVIVMVALKVLAKGFQAKAGAYGEGSEVIRDPARNRGVAGASWGHVIRQAVIELAARFVHLLAQETEGGGDAGARVVRVDFDIVTHGIGGEETVNASSGEESLVDDLAEQPLSVLEQFVGFGLVQDVGIVARAFPKCGRTETN